MVTFVGLTGGPIWYFRRRAIRNDRLRRKEIPYIMGEAIQDSAQFFGRRELLTRLRDTIVTTSYALVGEFRIGKTSIQYQFARLLESLQDPKYVFLPVFVDLQRLEKRNDRFFHFLGKHLIELAQAHGGSSSVLDHLEYQALPVERYDSIAFNDDLNILLEHWSAEFSPRKPLVVLQIDEVSLLSSLDYDTLLAFRAVFVSEPLIKTVLSGRSIPKNQDRPELSPWWNFLREIEVEPLTPTEAQELIEQPVRGVGPFQQREPSLARNRWPVGAYVQSHPFSLDQGQ